jgi:DnaJ family protein C protein 9
MIPHSTFTDESRLIGSINELISSGKLKSTKTWARTSTDEKSRAKREKAGKKEAREAEEAAKELGVWDEFYGSGTKGTRKGDEKSSGKKDKKDKKDKKNEETEGGEDKLAALILKRQRQREGGLDALAEKYRRIEEEEREKKKAKKGKKGKEDARVDENGMPVSNV